MKFVLRGMRWVFIVVCLAVMSTGCATSPGSYNLTSAPPGDRFSRYSDLCVEVTASQGLSLTPSDLDRIKGLIISNVPAESAGRFKCVDESAAGPATIRAKVTITKYDEGNAMARLMLAGLGQMHIDADVVLSDSTTNDQLLRSEVKKSFAWGGIYGGGTQITDIEDGFAKAVAASFSGKKQ